MIMHDDLNQSLNEGQKSAWAWVPLIFSAFYFLPVALSSQQIDGLQFVGIMAVYVAFLAFYYKAQMTVGYAAMWPTAGITVLAFFGTYFTAGTLALFAFSTYFLGFYLRLKLSLLATLLVLALVFLAGYLFANMSPYFLIPAVFCCVPNLCFGILERRTRIHERSKQKSQAQIEQLAAVAERERIARDLHDLLGHTLSAIALKSELAEKLGKAGQTDKALEEISQVASITRQTLSEVRQAVHGYKLNNINAEIDKLRDLMTDSAIDVSLDVNFSGLNAKSETSFILILKEAVTNILRHSTASQAAIVTTEQGNVFRLTISDNGQSQSLKKGNGLTGIEERVQELGGELRLNNDKGLELVMEFSSPVVKA